MSTLVFLGPTLPHAEAQALLPGAVVLPPAAQGDVFRAVRTHAPRRIGLIDGAFLDVPAPWHRELLWAMTQGVAVAGAASMGALRAAELHTFGMTGIGRIFAAYRDNALPGWDGPFEDDDEVAVIHGPAELGHRALSTAMIDLRATLDAALAEGLIARQERDSLAARMKALHFPHRTQAALADLAGARFSAWAATSAVSAKAEDARALLAYLADSPPPPEPPRMERALVWERFVAAQDAAVLGDDTVLRRLQNDGLAWRALHRAAAARAALLAEAPAPEPGDQRAALDRFRREQNLPMRADLDAWMLRHGLDAAGLAALLDREARLDRAAAHGDAPLAQAMLDLLRLEGRYAREEGQ